MIMSRVFTALTTVFRAEKQMISHRPMMVFYGSVPMQVYIATTVVNSDGSTIMNL